MYDYLYAEILDTYKVDIAEYTIVYHQGWSGYEDSHYITIISDENNNHFIQEEQYSAMACDHSPYIWNPTPITEEEALQEMLDMEEECEQFARDYPNGLM